MKSFRQFSISRAHITGVLCLVFGVYLLIFGASHLAFMITSVSPRLAKSSPPLMRFHNEIYIAKYLFGMVGGILLISGGIGLIRHAELGRKLVVFALGIYATWLVALGFLGGIQVVAYDTFPIEMIVCTVGLLLFWLYFRSQGLRRILS